MLKEVNFMYTWSKMRSKLENDYLAESLKGRIQYFVTRYRDTHDQEGRASIKFDGEEILKGSYCEMWSKESFLKDNEKYRLWSANPKMDEVALKYGQFDQRCFYRAFEEFDNQAIEKSLESENLLVRIFAILDRRLGKRRLEKIKENVLNEPEMFQIFCKIRLDAENL